MSALTATIEVKFVKPPAPGKQYGSVKSSDNTWWPVKADRINQFQENNSYEVAYTEGTNGFRNIIGVKSLAPPKRNGSVSDVALEQGQFTQVPPQAQPAPKASQSEHIFTCGGLYRDIEMGRVGTSEDELVERTVLWRNVYRRAFPE